MRQFWFVTALVASLLSGQAIAADQEERAQRALDKAEVLEEHALEGSNPPRSKTITEAEAVAVDPEGAAPIEDTLTCLSRTLYWEAKGVERNEMEAVASVVMNRLAHDGFPKSICEVVKQGSESGPCQFSWWCDGRPDHVREEEPYEMATDVARIALNGRLKDRTKGALYFHDKRVSPAWANEFKRTLEAGDFYFYKPAEGAAR